MRKDYDRAFSVPHTQRLPAVEKALLARLAKLHLFCLADAYDVKDFRCTDMPDLPGIRAVMRERAMNCDLC